MLIVLLIKAMHMSTFNRKHKYKEHYMNKQGESNHMTLPM